MSMLLNKQYSVAQLEGRTEGLMGEILAPTFHRSKCAWARHRTLIQPSGPGSGLHESSHPQVHEWMEKMRKWEKSEVKNWDVGDLLKGERKHVYQDWSKDWIGRTISFCFSFFLRLCTRAPHKYTGHTSRPYTVIMQKNKYIYTVYMGRLRIFLPLIYL